LKTKDKEKIFASSERETSSYLERKNNWNNSRFLTRNHRSRKKWYNIFQVPEKKGTVSLEFHIQQKYPSRKREIKTFSAEGKLKDLLPAD